jgi:hypothetical protein
VGSSIGRRPRLLRLDSLPKRDMGESLVEATVEAAKASRVKKNRPDMLAARSESRKTGRGEVRNNWSWSTLVI